MQTKEEKICSFTQEGTRLQLIKLTKEMVFVPYYKDAEGNLRGGKTYITRYQVRLNRKVIETSISEYTMRKLFAMMAQNIVLQLKIY